MSTVEHSPTDDREYLYLNIPLSIIDQRWFKNDNAVRAWFFLRWHFLLPGWEKYRPITIDGKTFWMEGEKKLHPELSGQDLGYHKRKGPCLPANIATV